MWENCSFKNNSIWAHNGTGEKDVSKEKQSHSIIQLSENDPLKYLPYNTKFFSSYNIQS